MKNLWIAARLFTLVLALQASSGLLFSQQPTEAVRPEQALVLALLPSGFQQTDFSTPAGITAISLRNYSFIPDVTLQLDRVGESRLRSVAVERTKPVWRDRIELTPGEYILSVVEAPDRPEWKVRITVGPKRNSR